MEHSNTHDAGSRTNSPPVQARKLNSWEVTAISVGFMGPVMAMSLNGIGVAGLVGKAVPLTFFVAFIGTLFVGYAFIRLLREFTHAGSVYALSGITLGPKAGFFGGFALLGTYTFLTACILGACSVFFEAMALELGATAPGKLWIAVPIIVGLCGLFLNLRNSQVAARITLLIGLIGILVMLILAVIIISKVGSPNSPVTTGVDWSVFSPTETTWDGIMTASVFAFISWAGFESGSALGEETKEPKKVIPRSLLAAITVGGIVYVFIMFAQSLGYGTDAAGIEKFANASSTLTELASMYVGSWYSILLSVIAFAVAFGAYLSSSTATSRLIFALARDGFGPQSFATQNPRTQVPTHAVIFTNTATVLMTVLLGLFGATNVEAYYWYATIGTLCMVIAYGMASVGAIKYICSKTSTIPTFEVIFPIVSLIYLVFVFFVQIVGQEPPYTYFPWIAGGWCLLGLVIVLSRPDLTKRIGGKMASFHAD